MLEGLFGLFELIGLAIVRPKVGIPLLILVFVAAAVIISIDTADKKESVVRITHTPSSDEGGARAVAKKAAGAALVVVGTELLRRD